MKHLKLRDILEFLMWSFAIIALIALAGFLESAPLGITMWVAVILAVILWIVWGVLVIRERNAAASAPKLKIMHNGQWVDVAEIQSDIRPISQPLFDQDKKEESA